jgi:EF hand
MVTVLPALSLVLMVAAATPAMPPTTMPTNTAHIEARTGPVTVRSGPTVALPNAADYDVAFEQLDANHDGRITRNEVPAAHALASEFKLVDRNHNGRISPAELAGWR